MISSSDLPDSWQWPWTPWGSKNLRPSVRRPCGILSCQPLTFSSGNLWHSYFSNHHYNHHFMGKSSLFSSVSIMVSIAMGSSSTPWAMGFWAGFQAEAAKVHHVARVLGLGGWQAWNRHAAGEREGLTICGTLRSQACQLVSINGVR